MHERKKGGKRGAAGFSLDAEVLRTLRYGRILVCWLVVVVVVVMSVTIIPRY